MTLSRLENTAAACDCADTTVVALSFVSVKGKNPPLGVAPTPRFAIRRCE
jgi:hypothetical protein